MITVNSMRTLLAMAGVSIVLLSCSPDDRTDGLTSAQMERRDMIFDVLSVSVSYVAQKLGHDRLPPDQLVIRTDHSPQVVDPFDELGLNRSAVMRQFAESRGYRALTRGEAVACESDESLRSECRLTFEGVYYAPVLLRLSAERAEVTVGYDAGPRRNGARILELELGPEGWEVVDESFMSH